MSKRSKQIKRDRYYSRNLPALMAMAKRLGVKAQESSGCDECDWGQGRHWKKERHAWSFWAVSYTECGPEADWSCCGYCLPKRYREEMSEENFWRTREGNRRWREFERGCGFNRRRST